MIFNPKNLDFSSFWKVPKSENPIFHSIFGLNFSGLFKTPGNPPFPKWEGFFVKFRYFSYIYAWDITFNSSIVFGELATINSISLYANPTA